MCLIIRSLRSVLIQIKKNSRFNNECAFLAWIRSVRIDLISFDAHTSYIKEISPSGRRILISNFNDRKLYDRQEVNRIVILEVLSM